MQLSKIMIAVAAMAAGTAMAATLPANIGISSGASASKNNFKLALANRCPGVLAEYTDGTTNASTYVCAATGSTFSATPTAAEYAAATPQNFTNTTIAEVRLNVNGGSFTAVCLLAGWPGGTKCGPADLYVDPTSATPATAAALSYDPAGQGNVTLGGLMDLEPAGFTSVVRQGIANPGNVRSANFGQTFGVAASPSLYNAMFSDQRTAGTLPASCAVTDTAIPACVPVIGKAQMATIMSGNQGSALYTAGANFLAPSIPAGSQLTYARRVDTSGTQAAAQQYFLGNVCSTASIGVVPESASAGAVQVTAFPSTGGVRGALNNASTFVIGVISGENDQTGQNWRWLRVGGMSIGENAAPAIAGNTNTNTALNGLYDYWFLSRIAQPAATGTAATFWTSIVTGFGSVPANNTRGLFRSPGETLYTKGTANSCLPASSN